MIKQLFPGATIGIVGAGQLGKMLAQSAQKMGYKVALYDPNPNSCGFAVAHHHTIASFDDEAALMAFAQTVDVLTYEFENINGTILAQLSQKANLPQGTHLLQTSQHRLSEKQWLQANDIPVVPFMSVETSAQLDVAIEQLGLPILLKSARFGYDGKGQLKLNTLEDLSRQQTELAQLLQQPCVAEAYCPFDYEVSVIVARDGYGNIELFPLSVNEHCNGILYQSVVGVSIPDSVVQQVHSIAKKIAHEAQLIGVCGIEFFVLKTGEVVVNELAPRPHNTGHYSIEACNVSQFDQHILAITGRQLVPVTLLSPARMVNILGQHIEDLPAAFAQFPHAMFHLYDKGTPALHRKMGHFTELSPEAQFNQQPLTEWKAKFK